jgi:catechol 2,3-dioxygenase-like lactoylglutathione lyase family enzyme
MDRSCGFYRDLLGAEQVNEHAVGGEVLVRQIAVGGALLSVHQVGNGVELVAERPTVGAADFCMRWGESIESAVSLLREHGVEIVEGPTPRRTADGLPSRSVFFRDPDGNLLELMAAD